MRISEAQLRRMINEEIGRLNEAADRAEEQMRGVTIKVRPLARGKWKWTKTVGIGEPKTGKADSEQAAWRAAIDA